MKDDLISRQAAIEAFWQSEVKFRPSQIDEVMRILEQLPSVQPDNSVEMKQEFLRMASYIDVLLECSDEQKETLLGFVSRMSEFMPWNERD